MRSYTERECSGATFVRILRRDRPILRAIFRASASVSPYHPWSQTTRGAQNLSQGRKCVQIVAFWTQNPKKCVQKVAFWTQPVQTAAKCSSAVPRSISTSGWGGAPAL